MKLFYDRVGTQTQDHRGAVRSMLDQGGAAPPLVVLGAKLAEKASVIRPHPLLDEPPLIVKPEEIQQVEDNAFAVRRQRAHRRLGELSGEYPLDPRLAGNMYLPSATIMPRRMERSSNAPRTDWK
jgi:hypothetical protein